MDAPEKIDRRRALTVLGATTTFVACGGRPDTTDDGTPSDPDPLQGAPELPTEPGNPGDPGNPGSPDAAAPAFDGGSGGPSVDSGGGGEDTGPSVCSGTALAADASITPGGYFIYGGGSRTFILGRDPTSGELFGMSGLCTHARCALTAQPSRNQWYCRCHGARFDYNGNSLTTSIARRPLQHYEVAVCDGQVYLDPSKPVS